MTALIKYDAALAALAECKSVDEVKSWTDKAAAMQAYGRMAQDKSLEITAAEIRMRAERRLGELIAAQKETVGLNPGGRPAKTGSAKEPVSPTLTEAGIDKKLSMRAQALAAIPAEAFETKVAEWRETAKTEGERVTAKLTTTPRPPKPKPADPKDTRIKELEEEVETLKIKLQQADDSMEEAGEQLRLADAVTDGTEAKMIEGLQADLRLIKRERDDWMTRAGGMNNTIEFLKKKLNRYRTKFGEIDKGETRFAA